MILKDTLADGDMFKCLKQLILFILGWCRAPHRSLFLYQQDLCGKSLTDVDPSDGSIVHVLHNWTSWTRTEKVRKHLTL